MNQWVRFCRFWLPAILWMAVIFTFSSQQRVEISPNDTINFIIFKTLHTIEYASLYFLLFRGFYAISDKKLTLPEKYLWPIIIALLYAASDEFHQTLTPHREGTPRDVLIDSIGIGYMYWYCKKYLNIVKKLI